MAWGTSLTYSACHAYLERNSPKTGACGQCGAMGSTHRALINGLQYSKNPADYLELCPPCHNWYDQGGERNSQAKLTEAQVAEIRDRYVPSRGGPGRKPNSVRALACEFGVSHTVISRIVRKLDWSRA